MFEKFVQGDAAVSQIYHRDGRVRAELVVDRQPPEVLHPGESALHDPPPPRRHEVPARQLGPRGDLAPSLTITLSARLPPRPPSAMILLRRRDAPRSPSRTSMVPLPSWTLAGCTAAPMTSPRLSVTTCRLRPSTFLFPSMPRFASTRCDVLTLRESMMPRLGSRRLPSLHRASPTSSADSCSSPPSATCGSSSGRSARGRSRRGATSIARPCAARGRGPGVSPRRSFSASFFFRLLFFP